MAFSNRKHLKNGRCRRMLNLVDDFKNADNIAEEDNTRTLNDDVLAVTTKHNIQDNIAEEDNTRTLNHDVLAVTSKHNIQDNIPWKENTLKDGLLSETSEHSVQSRQSSRKRKVVSSNIENENAASDEDFSPETSEYVPSRSISPDFSPEGNLHSSKRSKTRISQKISSLGTNNSNSSLPNTPKNSRYLNFIASPTVLYAINDELLPEISNIESFIRNFEQSQDEPSILQQPLLSQTEREKYEPDPGLSREEFQIRHCQTPEKYPGTSRFLKFFEENIQPLQLQIETEKESDDPRTSREYLFLNECQLPSENHPVPTHSALEITNTFQLIDQDIQPLHAEIIRESDEPDTNETPRDYVQQHECQISTDECSIASNSILETETLQVVRTRPPDEPSIEVVCENNNNVEPLQILDVSQGEQCQVLDAEITPNRSRKRVNNEKDWIDVVNKRLKNSGKAYISIRSKKAREEKHLRETCTCKRQCREKIDEEIRKKIFELYWNIGNHEKQWDFILKHLSSNTIKRMQLIRKNNRTQTIIYELPCNLDMTDKIVVCKKMFLGTLGITEKVVYTAIEKKNTAMVDYRGTHTNRPRKMSEETEKNIVNHIKSFPVVESHYTRKDSTRLYLNETLNQSKMYRLYKEWYNSNPDNEVIKMASKSQYDLVFNTKFNYSFFCPKKDLCEQCAVFYTADTERKAQLQEAFEKHREEKETVRKMKDLEKAQFDKSTMTVACFDLEKVLHIPQSEVSSFYYKRKYPVYNFTIYNVLSKKGYCYVWHYQIAKRGANDIASCLYHYIQKEVSEGRRTISFYSDSCSGQNRNRIVFAMYQLASKMFGVNITHRFFVKGHSQSEGDTMHSCIERAKKRHTIYTPDQMYCIVENAKVSGEKFKVKEMQQSDFYDFKNLVSDRTKNWLQNDHSEKIYWSKIREVKVDSTTPDKIYYRNRLEEEYKSLTSSRQVSRRRKNMPSSSDNVSNLQPAYNALIKVPKPLYNDLISLCDSEAIPVQYQDFYRKLVPQNQVTGAVNAPDSDFSEDD